MNHLEKRIKQIFPFEDVEVLEYISMHHPSKVKCKKCGSIYELKQAQNFVRKNKKCICKKCVNNKSGGRLDSQEFQKRINQKYPKEKLQVLNYSLKDRPCSIKCLVCGSVYTLQNASSFQLKNKKVICKKCYPNKNSLINQTIKKFQNWQKKQSYYNFQKKDFPLEIHSHTLIKGYCKECGNPSFKTMYDYMRDRGCKYCKKNSLKTLQQMQQEIGQEYTILSYKGMDHKSKFKHNLCGFIYNASPKTFSCPRCKGSRGEKAIRYYLISKQINFEQQKNFVIKGHKLRVDFYLPDYDIILEYQGEQHFRPIEHFGGDEAFKKRQLYDNYKREYFRQKMIEITYLENIKEKLNDIFKNLEVHRLS